MPRRVDVVDLAGVPHSSILLDIGPVISIVFVVGLVVLLRRDRRHQDGWLAAGFGLFVVLLLVTGGKAYYSGGFDPAVLAAGAGPVLDWVLRGRPARRIIVGAALVVSVIVTAMLALPLARPGTTLFAVPSGEPGPGKRARLAGVRPRRRPGRLLAEPRRPVADGDRRPVVRPRGRAGRPRPGHRSGTAEGLSGHNAYWFWGPPPDSATDAIVIGDFTPAELSTGFGHCELRRTVAPPDGVENDLAGTKIYWCTQLQHPWSQLWPTLKSFA